MGIARRRGGTIYYMGGMALTGIILSPTGLYHSHASQPQFRRV